MREFSLDLDKITKTIFFCKKVFVSTCLHCFNAATPLNTIYKHVMYVSICEYTEINVLFLGVGLLWHHICVNVMIGLFYLTHRSKSVTNIKLSSTTRVYFAPALPTSSNQNVHHIRNLCPSLWCKTTNFFFFSFLLNLCLFESTWPFCLKKNIMSNTIYMTCIKTSIQD
jgi:hypothetical protein